VDYIENVDLRKALMDIAKANTFYHLDNDINISFEQMERTTNLGGGTDNTFIWVSYPSGIDCYSEREVLQKSTSAYNGVQYHGAGMVHEIKLAYAVDVEEVKDGSIYGNIIEIDIREYADFVHAHAVDSNAMRIYADDYRNPDNQIIMPLDEFNSRYPNDLPKMLHWRNEPADQAALGGSIIKAGDLRLIDTKQCSIWTHSNCLYDKRISYHADKLIKGINQHNEPNSADKQSFITTLDVRVADNFGVEQLKRVLDKLPYENAAFTIQKGNIYGNMVLVVPKNEVLQLRQEHDKANVSISETLCPSYFRSQRAEGKTAIQR
jgi:hypothetical protein